MAGMTYLLNNAIALDQQLNTLLCGAPDETLSARAWRTEQTGKFFGKFFRPVIDTFFLLFLQREHCKKAYFAELRRNQLPKDYR
jgi:hypothetical protein